jgi:hypothetical protein
VRERSCKIACYDSFSGCLASGRLAKFSVMPFILEALCSEIGADPPEPIDPTRAATPAGPPTAFEPILAALTAAAPKVAPKTAAVAPPLVPSRTPMKIGAAIVEPITQTATTRLGDAR